MQTTIKSAVVFTGAGLHSGRGVRMSVHPAPADHGIRFRRSDIHLGDAVVAAHWANVSRSPLCTRIVNGAGVSVSTIEHLMAALAGCGIHNALIELDGPEVPILDGSAAPFVRAFRDAGLRRLQAPLRVIEVLAPVTADNGNGWARLSPAAVPGMDFHIAFEDTAIGVQDRTISLANGAFMRDLSDSRTFCRRADVEKMQASGLALGGTYDNAVVVDGARVLSPGGLRHKDEAVRHKMLDAVGDLALAGAPIVGHYTGMRAGHALTNALLRTLFATPSAFRVKQCPPSLAARLPGAGVLPGVVSAVA